MTSAPAAGFAIGLTLLGCSSSSSGSPDAGGASCGNVAPCGGDILGTWRIVGSCSSSSMPLGLNGFCPNLAVEKGSASISGTAIFSLNGTYTLYVTQAISGTLAVPTSCLESHGVTVTCDELAMALGGGRQDDSGVTTTMGTCSASGSTCDCAFASSGKGTYETGKYGVSGSTLSTTWNGSTNLADYCVQGNTLRVVSPMGTSTLLSTSGLVATKE